MTLSCQLFLQTEEKRWSLCAKQRKHSSSQEVIIHSVISRGVFFFFLLTQEDKSLTQTHRLQPGAFYFIHLLIYLNVTLDVTAPNVCFCCCQVGQVLIKSCRVVSEQSRNILAVGELTSVHCSGLNVGTLYTGVFLNHVQLVASTLLTADILTCHCSDSTVQTNVKAENSFPAVSFLIAIIWRS